MSVVGLGAGKEISFFITTATRGGGVWIPPVSFSDCTKSCFYRYESDRSLSSGDEFIPSRTQVDVRIDLINVRMVTRFMWFSEKSSITSVSSDCIASLFKVIHCVSLKVEIVFIKFILISCLKRTAIYDFYVHLRTSVPQGWNATLIGETLACCTDRACFIVFKVTFPHLLIRKQRNSRNTVTNGKAKHSGACCQNITNFLTARHDLTSFRQLQPSIRHAPRPFPPTSHRDCTFP